jgi:predicted dehydrogenase
MNDLSRKKFLEYTASAGAAMLLYSLESFAKETPDKKMRVAVIGCGSVSNRYLPQLLSSSLIQVVSLCDIKYDRAVNQNKQYNVNATTYPHIDKMLAGVPFDMMVTLTDMQVHGDLNKIALNAGKHVWSEKPMANTYAEGKALLDLAKSKGVRFWGARQL